MAIVFLNNFSTVTVNPLAPADTTLEPQDGIADIVAALTGGNTLVLTLFTADDQGNETQREIIHATAADEVGGTVTIERGKEGTAAGTWAPNTGVEQRLTAGVVGAFIMGVNDEPTTVAIGNIADGADEVNNVVIGEAAEIDFADNAVAIGYKAYIGSGHGVAVGDNTVADGDNAIAIGANAEASDDNCIAIGASSVASNNDCVVVGHSAKSTDRDSVVIGHSAESTDRDSVTIGADASSTGDDSVTIGVGASTTADDTVAIGEGASASADDAIAIGKGAEANVKGGLQFSAVSYAAKQFGDSAAMQSVLVSGEIDLSDAAAAAEIKAPSGTLLMPDAIDIVSYQTKLPHFEKKSVTALGVAEGDYLYGIYINHQETIIIFDVGSELVVFSLPEMTEIPAASTGLTGTGEIILDVSFSPDGSLIAVTKYGSSNPKVYDTDNWSEVSAIGGPEKKYEYAQFSADGSHLVAIYYDSTDTYMVVFQTSDWTEVEKTPINGDGLAIRHSPDNNYLALGTSEEVAVFLTSDYSRVTITPSVGGCDDAVFSPDGKYLAVAHGDFGTGGVTVVDTSDWTVVSNVEDVAVAPERKVKSACFTSDSRLLLATLNEAPGLAALDVASWTTTQLPFAVGAPTDQLVLAPVTGDLYVDLDGGGTYPFGVYEEVMADSALISVGSGEKPSNYLLNGEAPEGGAGSRAAFSPLLLDGVESLSVTVSTPEPSVRKARAVVRGYLLEV